MLAGKYRVERVLGRGGMGVVVAARHVELDQAVAVKFMLEGAAMQPDAAERFLREARAAVRLRGEHVAKVIDVGRLDNGAPYMVMEFLGGTDLEEVLRERRILLPQQAVDYIVQACAAMAEAHGQGIIHRDLKPANLFLTYRPDGRPCVKVLDFGISKILDAGEATATTTGIAMGTPAYMAPEQMRSARDADARADVWALGAMLYHLLSGQLPFYAQTVTEMMAKVLTEDPPPLHTVAPGVPPALCTAVHRCLVRDRNQRVQSVIDLARMLAPFASDEGKLIAAHLSGWGESGHAPGSFALGTAPAHAATAAASAAMPAMASVAPPPRRRAGVVIALVALAGVAVAAIVIAAAGGSDADEDKPAEPAVAPAPAPAPAPVAVQHFDAAPPPPDATMASPPDAAPVKKKTRTRRPKRGDLFDSID